MVSEVEEIVSSQDGVYTRDLCTTDTSVQLALPQSFPVLTHSILVQVGGRREQGAGGQARWAELGTTGKVTV